MGTYMTGSTTRRAWGVTPAQVTQTIGRRVLEPLLDLINQPHLSVVMSSFYLEIHRKRVT